jgi:uncharacterized protein YuzE
VDIDETGAVCGVELLNAAEQLKAGDGGRLAVLNRLTGDHDERAVA